MEFRDILKVSGLDRKQFAVRYGVPIRTVNSWCQGVRTPPAYVLALFTDVIMLERMLKDVKTCNESVDSTNQGTK